MKSTLSLLMQVAAAEPASRAVRVSRGVVAAAVVLIAVAQLFTFEDFPGLLDALWESSGMAASYILATAIVTCEVFAVPFLLSMPVTPLMRLVSMVCGWFVGVVWVLVAAWQLGTPDSTAVGVLGATVSFPGKGLLLGVSIALALALAYGTYAVWPSKTARSAHKK